ncbi:UTRA domain-containing protein, partial [Bordetella pertussis]|uniref:UTRA domain-containing protein n=3 Tax=Bordetella TaxID=517 RepID=UPI0021CB227B
LERLRSVDAQPLAYVRTWLPRAAIAGLAADHLQDASLHRVLAQRFGLRPGRGR